MAQYINGHLIEIIERNHSLALAEGGLFFAIKANGRLIGLADTFEAARNFVTEMSME